MSSMSVLCLAALSFPVKISHTDASLAHTKVLSFVEVSDCKKGNRRRNCRAEKINFGSRSRRKLFLPSLIYQISKSPET